MNIAQLSTFVAVIETGSLTAAARRTGVTQPGVTRQMQRLELELGVALLERLPTGVRSSPEGERFLAFARETLQGYAELLGAIQDPTTPLEGRLRINREHHTGRIPRAGTSDDILTDPSSGNDRSFRNGHYRRYRRDA
jgi:DNA-binding transcriptional LysR family regulator